MSIVCNTCSVVGHRTRECPTVVCHFCGHRGHVKSTCPEVVCRGCGRSGHFVASCQQLRTVEPQRQHEPVSDAHASSTELREDHEDHSHAADDADAFGCEVCGARGHSRRACPRVSSGVDGSREQEIQLDTSTSGSIKRARTAHPTDDDEEQHPCSAAPQQSSTDPRRFFGNSLVSDGRLSSASGAGKCGCMLPLHSPADCPRLSLHHTSSASTAPSNDAQHTGRCSHCGRGGHYAPHCPRLKDRCFHCATPGHLSTSCPLRALDSTALGTTTQVDGESGVVGDGKRICYECHRPGHFASTCPQRRSCRNCKEVGHLQAHCPQSECRSCHQLGHYASVCPVAPGTHLPPPSGATVTAASGPTQAEKAPAGVSDADGADDTVHTPSSLGDVVISLPPSAGSVAEEESRTTTQHERSPPPPPPQASSAAATSTVRRPMASVPLSSSLLTRSDSTSRRRVAVVIDGAYLERSIRRNMASSLPATSSSCASPQLRDSAAAAFYSSCKGALQHILQHLGAIFDMQPIAFWYALNPSAVYDYCANCPDGGESGSSSGTIVVSSSSGTQTLQNLKAEVRLRSRFLMDSMTSYQGLSHVVVRTAGFLSENLPVDGASAMRSLAVERGVDVALASCVMECFADRQRYQQVILLSGDAALSSVVQLCNATRRDGAAFVGQPPVRVCACSSDMSPIFLQHQDLGDFLPIIYLDAAEHEEPFRAGGSTVPFPAASLFSRPAS